MLPRAANSPKRAKTRTLLSSTSPCSRRDVSPLRHEPFSVGFPARDNRGKPLHVTRNRLVKNPPFGGFSCPQEHAMFAPDPVCCPSQTHVLAAGLLALAADQRQALADLQAFSCTIQETAKVEKGGLTCQESVPKSSRGSPWRGTHAHAGVHRKDPGGARRRSGSDLLPSLLVSVPFRVCPTRRPLQEAVITELAQLISPISLRSCVVRNLMPTPSFCHTGVKQTRSSTTISREP